MTKVVIPVIFNEVLLCLAVVFAKHSRAIAEGATLCTLGRTLRRGAARHLRQHCVLVARFAKQIEVRPAHNG
jgi:hypothetical protein